MGQSMVQKKTVKNEYLWMLNPISERSRKIRKQGQKEDARRAGVWFYIQKNN